MKSISFKREKTLEGYLTLFLALSMTVILSLCLALIEGAGKNGARFMTEYAMDIGMNSILAEYHRELLKQYDLFFIDTSYGSPLPSIGKTAEHLQAYMEGNFSAGEVGMGIYGQDLFGLSVQNIRIGNLAVATDRQGKVLRAQAISYMTDKYGLSLFSEVEQWEKVVEEYELQSESLSAQRNDVESQIASVDGSQIQISEEEWVTITVDNPADEINAQRNKGVLLLVMKDTDSLSNVGFSIDNAVSARTLYQGQGPIKERSKTESLVELLLFDEYLLEKCSYYGQELEKSRMKYQIEYLLVGKDNDLDNLKSIALRLLAIREAANAGYLFSSGGKRAMITALATAVSVISLVPWLQPLLEYSILFAWSFAESVYDVRTLFDGGKVPLVKNDQNWHTDISVLFGGLDGDNGQSGTGMSYADYLRVFLKLAGTDTKTMRFADMAELDIRKTEGNENFRMDGCIDGMTIEANIISRYADAFLIQRDCCYE